MSEFDDFKKKQQAEMDAFRLQQQIEMDALRGGVNEDAGSSDVADTLDPEGVDSSEEVMSMTNVIRPIENPADLMSRADELFTDPQAVAPEELKAHLAAVAEGAGFEIDEFTLDDIVMSIKDPDEMPMYLQGRNAKADITAGEPEGINDPKQDDTVVIVQKSAEEYVIENGRRKGEPQEDHNARL